MSLALITTSPLAIVQMGVLPFIHIPGLGDVHAATQGWTSPDGKYMVVDVQTVGAPVNQWSVLLNKTLSLAGSVLTVTSNYSPGVPTKDQLIAYAGSKRAAKMLGGTTVSGVAVATDPGNLVTIIAAYLKASADNTFTLKWNNNGTWITLTAAQIIGAAQAVAVFLAGCLAAEQTAVADINGGTITTAAQVDALF